MGFFDKLKGELVDIIEWLDDTNGQTLVWRFPRYQNEIKNKFKIVLLELNDKRESLKKVLEDVEKFKDEIDELTFQKEENL